MTALACGQAHGVEPARKCTKLKPENCTKMHEAHGTASGRGERARTAGRGRMDEAGRGRRGRAQDGAENGLILRRKRRKRGKNGTARRKIGKKSAYIGRHDAVQAQTRQEKCTLKFPAGKILN